MSFDFRRRFATASAPASIGNVGVGFDVLGLAFDVARDRVRVRLSETPGVRLADHGAAAGLPAAVEKNTALRAAASVLRRRGASVGLDVSIDKGVPMSAGMGGSAASAVAAALAAHALFDHRPDPDCVLLDAVEGERASSDPPPWDNVAASLYGGLTLVARLDPPFVRRLPAPVGHEAILFHPDAAIDTAEARAAMAATVPLGVAVEHSRHMASFVAGCALGDEALMRAGLRDILAEPQRRHLFPLVAPVQAAAIGAGALGCSFSGAGPSVFALTTADRADAVSSAMSRAFEAAGVGARAYRAGVAGAGARLEAPA